jgi:hypothetical protein
MRRRFAVSRVFQVILTVILAGAARVACAASAPGGQYGLEADLEGQYKPAAIDINTEAWYRYVYHSDPSRLWNGLYIKGGGALDINPAYGRAGAYVEWMPVAVLQLRAQFDRYAFFGSNGSLLVYNDKNAPFGAGQYKARRGQEISGQADRLVLQPTLRGTLGHYVLVNQVTYALYDFKQDGPYFWEQEYDTLLKKRDRLYADDLSVLYDFAPAGGDGRLLIGPSFEAVHAFGADLTRTRVGLSLYFEPGAGKHTFGYRAKPRIYFQAGINTRDRNRHGQAYALGGIGVELDLD